ncbi:hypothetical protein TrCOL_g2321 [Triparma columacea]|uniref:Uncharacterized protein n=1 Tax=Triparma columacea TaxID=722753 RepID=A0A9W7L660_9STRA|nr:hypothetical protein TrCOL_g2321 [Triparma columacea]
MSRIVVFLLLLLPQACAWWTTSSFTYLSRSSGAKLATTTSPSTFLEQRLQSKIYGDNSEGSSSSRLFPSGPGELFNVPVKTIKPSGLRLSLALVALGLQNTPVQGAWVAQQEDDGVTIFWNDGTAALNVKISYLGILFTRMGEEPSLPYQLNESNVIRELLEEIEDFGKGDGGAVEETNRLVTFDEEGWAAIENAKGMLIKDAN